MLRLMPPRMHPELRTLLHRQRGMVADWQAAELGVTRRALVRACSSGWARVGRHVFVDRDGDLTAAQLRMSGVLEFGPHAILTGSSALLEAGWQGDDPGVVDVLAPRNHRGRSAVDAPWWRVHFPHELPARTGLPARVLPAHACIDAAARSTRAREVLLLVTSSVQQRVVGPHQLRREVAGRRRLRNRSWIVEALGLVGDGATSSNEADFLRECRRRGLPKPEMQVRRVDATGRRRCTDAEWALPDGRRLIVEIDGVGHLAVAQWHADLQRNNALAVASGAVHLHVTGWQIRHDPDPFFDLVVGMLDANGQIFDH